MASILAPVDGAATITNIPALSTTPVQIAAFSPSNGTGVRRVRITNDHATQTVAFLVVNDSSTPSVVSSATGTIAATEGIRIYGKSHEYINVRSTSALWVVASAASTPCQVVCFDGNSF